MSPGKAIVGQQAFYGIEAELDNFDDRWVVRLDTDESGSYVLMGCVTVTNLDSDPQWTSVKLVRRDRATPFLAPPEVLFDVSPPRQMPGKFSAEFYVQAPVRQRTEYEMFTIDCNTYKGTARNVSLIALMVDYLVYNDFAGHDVPADK